MKKRFLGKYRIDSMRKQYWNYAWRLKSSISIDNWNVFKHGRGYWHKNNFPNQTVIILWKSPKTNVILRPIKK